MPKPRRRTLATSYLDHAVKALRDSISPDALFDSDFRSIPNAAREQMHVYVATGMAHRRRTTFVHSSMIFAAFAAEAYANEFVREHFPSRQDFATVDRWSTVDKYLLAPRLALGEAILERGREPAQTLIRLFKRRNALAHPKPEDDDDEPSTALDADPIYSPVEAARMIIAVADAAQLLVRAGRLGDGFDMMAQSVIAVRAELVRFGESGMGPVPHPDAPPQPEYLLSGLRKSAGWKPLPAIRSRSDEEMTIDADA